MQLMIIAAIFVGIGAVAFAMQNNLPVTVNFLLWRFDSSLAMVLLLALATGAIVVALLTTPGTLRRQWQLTRQRRQLDELEKRCDAQRVAMAELERRIAAAAGAAPAQTHETPYVGLKQLIVGERPGEGATTKPPEAS
jgi:lipopolysaccharide assembly protein A